MDICKCQSVHQNESSEEGSKYSSIHTCAHKRVITLVE